MIWDHQKSVITCNQPLSIAKNACKACISNIPKCLVVPGRQRIESAGEPVAGSCSLVL